MKKIVSIIILLVMLICSSPNSFAGNEHYSYPGLASFDFKAPEFPKIEYSSFNFGEMVNFDKIYFDIRKGDSGEHVRELQKKLNTLGYSTNGIDGNFGDGTKDALIKFQSNNGLEITGVADAATQKMLDKLTSGSRDSISNPSVYKDGLKSDGKIHVYLVGKGETVTGKKSSSIKSMTYYADSDHLIINFNGKEYVFANVDSALWKLFKEASSSDAFYDNYIKGNKNYWINDYNGKNGGLIVMENVSSNNQQPGSLYSYSSVNTSNTQTSVGRYEPTYTACVVCGRIYSTDDMFDYGDEYICENCVDGGDYTACEGCDGVYYIDDLYDVGGSLFCEYCAEARYEDYGDW